jgi:hypothetical protein
MCRCLASSFLVIAASFLFLVGAGLIGGSIYVQQSHFGNKNPNQKFLNPTNVALSQKAYDITIGIGAGFIFMALLACVTIAKRINCLTSTFIVLNLLLGAAFVTGGVLGRNSVHQVAVNLDSDGLCSGGKGEFGDGVFSELQKMYHVTDQFFCTKFCPCDLGGPGEENLAKNVWQCKNKEAKAHMVQLQHMLSQADLTGEDISNNNSSAAEYARKSLTTSSGTAPTRLNPRVRRKWSRILSWFPSGFSR